MAISIGWFLSKPNTPWVLGVTKRSSSPDVPAELRAPEILSKPMEYLSDSVRAEIYKQRTDRVREYCKYMPNDTIIADMKMQEPDEVNEADFPMVVDPIHKILYCEVSIKLAIEMYLRVQESYINNKRRK